MVEQRFLRRSQSAAAPPLATVTSLNRTGIEIHLGEVEAKTNEIRHHYYIEATTKVCCINPAGAGLGCRQGHDAQLALNAEAQKILASRPERRAT